VQDDGNLNLLVLLTFLLFGLYYLNIYQALT